MGKLAKFFSKFSTDKFPKESQGRRLNENRPERDLKRLSNKSPPNAPRGPPSEGAQKAADAALSRIAAKQVPSSNFKFFIFNILQKPQYNVEWRPKMLY